MPSILDILAVLHLAGRTDFSRENAPTHEVARPCTGPAGHLTFWQN